MGAALFNRPFISIVIPCRNEKKYIGPCLNSIIANDYPKDQLEVLAVDGMSEDGTRGVLESYVEKYPYIRLLDNPRQITPSALNIGILNTKGEIIIRIDAHAWYEKDYISRCVESLCTHGADNVGGIMKAISPEDKFIGQAIVSVLSHRFGVGNSYFRVHTNKPKWVDTVFGGCYRREVFDRIGLFNEHLVRGQDMEFNLRLKAAGGRILLLPDIVSYYYPPSRFVSFCKHSFRNGIWAVLPFLYSPVMPVSWRHLVPLAFVLGLFVLSTAGSWMLFAASLFYAATNLAVSAQVALRKKDLRCLPVLSLIFASLHLSYGLGSLLGIVKVIIHVIARVGSKQREVIGRC